VARVGLPLKRGLHLCRETMKARRMSVTPAAGYPCPRPAPSKRDPSRTQTLKHCADHGCICLAFHADPNITRKLNMYRTAVRRNYLSGCCSTSSSPAMLTGSSFIARSGTAASLPSRYKHASETPRSRSTHEHEPLAPHLPQAPMPTRQSAASLQQNGASVPAGPALQDHPSTHGQRNIAIQVTHESVVRKALVDFQSCGRAAADK
jgi:hypothetical protein